MSIIYTEEQKMNSEAKHRSKEGWKAVEEEVTCFVCEGTGHINKQAFIRKLYGMELDQVTKNLIAQTADKFDISGTAFWKKLTADLEKQFEEKNQLKIQSINEDKKHEITAMLERQESLVSQFEREKAELLAKNSQKDEQLQKALQEASRMQAILEKSPASKGGAGERSFEEEAQERLPHWKLSEKLPDRGDFLITPALQTPTGFNLSDCSILIDHKDKKKLTDADFDKILRDAEQRNMHYAMIVCDSEDQLRAKDKNNRFQKHGNVLLAVSWRPHWVFDAKAVSCIIEMLEEKSDDVDFKQVFDDVQKKVLSKISKASEIVANSVKIRKILDENDEVAKEVEQEIRKIFQSATQTTKESDEDTEQ